MTAALNGTRPKPSETTTMPAETDTERNSAVGSADLTDVPAERETDSQTPDTLQSAPKSAVTLGDRWRKWRTGAEGYFTPPSIPTEPPASVDELRRYAERGAWTKRTNGPVRSFGIWWFRLIGLPKTVWNRYSEWIWQRPGRAIPVLLLVKLLASTTAGTWLVNNIVKPLTTFAIWLFL